MTLPKLPTSQQQLRDYSDVTRVIRDTVMAEDYFQLKRDYEAVRRTLSEIIEMINDGEFSPKQGSGSPEGVVSSNSSHYYIDNTASTLYYNPNVDVNTGWVAL